MIRHACSLVIAVALTAVVWTAPASASPSQETIDEAQEYFNKGDTAYNLGRYDEAVEWFTKAYETWPVPDFLYNIAQSYRLGGNCKQALHFYKRYLALKEKDKDAPLSKKDKKDIEKFIADLTECAEKADQSAQTTPDTVKQPDTTKTKPDTTKTKPDTTKTNPDTTKTKPDTTKTNPDTTKTKPDTTKTNPDVAVVEEEEEEEEEEEYEEDPSISTGVVAPTTVNARGSVGLGIFSAGPLKVPVQAAVNVGAGYPLPAGPVILDVGAGLSFSGIPYTTDTMESGTATLFGIRGQAGATYPVNEKIGVRGELGLGLSSLTGLADGNPFTDTQGAGSFGLFSLRLGVTAEYAVTPNIVAMLVPFSFTYNKAPPDLYFSALTEIDISLGVSYRM